MNWFQWVEWLLPIPDGRGSNLVICKNLYCTLTVNCIEKAKIKKKRPGMAHLKKNTKWPLVWPDWAFFKVFGYKFSYVGGENIWCYLGLLWKTQLLGKNRGLGNICKILASFLFQHLVTLEMELKYILLFNPATSRCHLWRNFPSIGTEKYRKATIETERR